MVHAEEVVAAHVYKLVGADVLLWLPAAGALWCIFAALYWGQGALMSGLNETDSDYDGAPMRDEGKQAEEERKRGALR